MNSVSLENVEFANRAAPMFDEPRVDTALVKHVSKNNKQLVIVIETIAKMKTNVVEKLELWNHIEMKLQLCSLAWQDANNLSNLVAFYANRAQIKIRLHFLLEQKREIKSRVAEDRQSTILRKPSR